VTARVIASLAEILTQDGLTVEPLASQIGVITSDPGDLLPMEISPSIAGVKNAKLWREPETGLPYLVRLQPAEDAKLTLDDLSRRFGEYRQSSIGPDRPQEIMFLDPVRAARWSVTVLASLSQPARPAPDSPVSSVSLRRDRNEA
jgi:hypothetical protein